MNRAKFDLTARNDRLTAMVEDRIGKTTADVYRRFLGKVEHRLLECHEGRNFDDHARRLLQSTCSIATTAVAALIPQHDELRTSIGSVADYERSEKILEHPKKKRRKEGEDSTDDSDHEIAVPRWKYPGAEGRDIEGLPKSGAEANGTHASLENGTQSQGQSRTPPQDRDRHTDDVRSHLILLARHPMKFIEDPQEGSHLSETWLVNYSDLVRKVQRREMANIISGKYGIRSMRVINILAQYGKLDDKTISSLSMIREKELRPLLTTMQQAGLLELQEVPRDNARLASRTTFLFFFDHDRCRRNLLEDCYRTMTRLLQRMRAERDPIKPLFDKIYWDIGSRSLIEHGKQVVGRWKDVEETFWGQVLRIDDTVALLRDY